MDFKDYYQVLGVARDATPEQIKKAFRRRARELHPDVNPAKDASTRMAEVNEAHAVLSDPEKRAAYDAVGAGHRAGEPFTPPPGWDAGFEFSGRGGASGPGDMSDFFEALFGHMGANMGARAGQGPTHRAPRGRGEDHHAKLVLDLEDAWRGATRQLSLRMPVLDAEGQVRLQSRTLEVRIPAGVRPGQKIRLAGQGAPGVGGAPAGDLFLEVQLHPHPRFRVEGGDVLAELPVAPWEAALGAVVPTTLPDGSTLKVRVPEGAQSGRALRVRGKGLPGSSPGDLVLELRVLLPSALDPRARQAYEAMAASLTDFDARRVARAEAEREAT